MKPETFIIFRCENGWGGESIEADANGDQHIKRHVALNIQAMLEEARQFFQEDL